MPRAAADDLLEHGHRGNGLVEHDQLAGLGIDAGGQQFRGGGDDREFALRVDEVVEFGLAFDAVAGDAHDVFGVVERQLVQPH